MIDEVSQIGPDIGRELLALGVQVLTFGDSVQLPPISGGKPFFDQFPIDSRGKIDHRALAALASDQEP